MSQEIEIKALKGESKTARLRIKPDATRVPIKKPDWIRIKLASGSKVSKLKKNSAFAKAIHRLRRSTMPQPC